jgi:DNA-binding CsgD family transcriptional regulator
MLNKFNHNLTINLFVYILFKTNPIMETLTLSKPGLKNQVGKIIAEKIDEVKKYEHDIPAAIIVLNVQDFTIEYISKRGREILDVTMEELKELRKDCHLHFFNPEDANEYEPKIRDLIIRNDDNEIVYFFQQIWKSTEKRFFWYPTCLKIILKDAKGEPLLALIIVIPIEHGQSAAAKSKRTTEEKNFIKLGYQLLETLTRRELEVLKLLAKGLCTRFIASQLFISEETVATHHKNIKRKLNAKTNYDIFRFAQTFDLI